MININQFKIEYIIITLFVVIFIIKTKKSINNKRFKWKSFITGLLTILLSIPIIFLLKPVLIYICIIAIIVLLIT